MDYDKHIDHLIDIVNEVPMHKVTILTGGNGRGKSFIRKMMRYRVEHEFDLPQGSHCLRSTSMQSRTESRPDMGALSGMLHDLPWNPTSTSTYHNIKMVMKDGNAGDLKGTYIVLDEIELGMSVESILGIVKFINEKYEEIKDKVYGMMVITHSDVVVKNLKHDCFLNIEGMTEDEWINREIVPTDFEKLRDEAIGLMHAIEDRNKK